MWQAVALPQDNGQKKYIPQGSAMQDKNTRLYHPTI